MTAQTRTVEISAPDGAMPAHLALPEGDGPFGAVVVIMEAFGLVPHMQGVAERVAGEGYVTVAPDFYYRELPDNKVGYDSLDRAIALMQRIDDEKFVADMGATLDFLAARDDVDTDRVGVMGFCMGGRLSFLTACALPERVAAVVPFYGGGIVGHLPQADRIRAPMRLFFGDRDAFIPLEQVRQIEARLGELDLDAQVQVYPGADHGFFCDERESYDAAAAGDAWSRLTIFFADRLGRGS